MTDFRRALDGAKRNRQLEKAIARLKELAVAERLCKCDQCKAIRAVLKAWKIK